MKQLTIKEIAPYLPYKLRFQIEKYTFLGDKSVYTDDLDCISPTDKMLCFNCEGDYYLDEEENNFSAKPILRNLSDLTKEIEHNGERFVPIIVLYNLYNFKVSICDSIEYLEEFKIEEDSQNLILFDKKDDNQHFSFEKEISGNAYWVVRRLLEWHFDIFSLIENGLAVDINTLNK